MSNNTFVKCSNESCTNPTALKCADCNRHYCRTHMATHTGFPNSLEEHIIKLADDINDLNPRNLFELLKTKLDETRRQGHRTVDQFYERERQKLEEQLRAPGKNLKEAQTKWRSLDSKSIITHEMINHLQKTVAQGEKELQEMQIMKEKGTMDFPKVLFSNGGSADAQNAIAFDGGMPNPLVAPAIPLSNTVLRIFNPVPVPVQFPIPGSGAAPIRSSVAAPNEQPTVAAAPVSSRFRFASDHRIFNCSNKTGTAMASNHDSLLFVENGVLLMLNTDLMTVDSTPWSLGEISDLAWSEKLNQYLVVNNWGSIYTINPDDLNSTEAIDQIPEEQWRSVTTSDRYLYLATFNEDPTIGQFDLFSAFQSKKQIKSPYICEQNDEIHQIRATDEKMLVLVGSPSKRTARLDVRSIQNFQLTWSRPLEILARSSIPMLRLCLLPGNEILVTCEGQPRVFYFDRNRAMETVDHKKPVWNAEFFLPRRLIIRTDRFMIVYPM